MVEEVVFRIDVHNHLLNEPDYASRLVEEADRIGIHRICLSGLGLSSDKWLGDLSPTNAA